MPYANNDGIRIHYEVEGDGPPPSGSRSCGSISTFIGGRSKR